MFSSHYPLRTVLFLIVLCLMVSCKKELKPATVVITDPVRHYYPVIQGEFLQVSFEMENTSDNPLFIKELQTTCGCLVPRNELPIVILPHKKGEVHVDFNTIKNTGYVCHYIYCYGNFRDTTCVTLEFDTNIVPPADYIRDYEQLWNELNNEVITPRHVTHKGYYTQELESEEAAEEDEPTEIAEKTEGKNAEEKEEDKQ